MYAFSGHFGGPVDRVGVEWLGNRSQQLMALSPGTKIGHYDVTALIGEGGMGQVWQATDTQLGRQVALKILPDAFEADPDRLARFRREAQVLASLNHPNIAAIYGIEEAEWTRALVLELVEGPTLADRISKGAIPLDEALPIAKQIAEALEAAHEQGVIHRDLKPANVKVKADGTVKVLDFGLAKAFQPDAASDPSESPTMTAAATRTGVIMGTAAYMSPEQAKGKPVDRRTDVWAFGCVLYEMLTARRAFPGDGTKVDPAVLEWHAAHAWGHDGAVGGGMSVLEVTKWCCPPMKDDMRNGARRRIRRRCAPCSPIVWSDSPSGSRSGTRRRRTSVSSRPTSAAGRRESRTPCPGRRCRCPTAIRSEEARVAGSR